MDIFKDRERYLIERWYWSGSIEEENKEMGRATTNTEISINDFLSINGNRLINNLFSCFDVLLVEFIEIDNKTST